MKPFSYAISVSVLTLAASSGRAVTIFDQLGANNSTNNFTSQDFEAGFDQFDGIVLDDFGMTADYRLTKFSFGAQTSTPELVSGYTVNIYSLASGPSTNSLVGDVASIFVTPAMATQHFSGIEGVIELDLSSANVLLPAGNYFIGVMSALEYGTDGNQIYNLYGNSPFNGEEPRYINPANGFALGANSSIGRESMNYKLEGTAVPEPATLGTLILGAGAMLRRRRGSSKPFQAG
jgi:hypothetical protein